MGQAKKKREEAAAANFRPFEDPKGDWRPLRDMVVLKMPPPPDRSEAGLHLISETTEETAGMATILTIVAIGPDVKELKVGDRVSVHDGEHLGALEKRAGVMIIAEKYIGAVFTPVVQLVKPGAAVH